MAFGTTKFILGDFPSFDYYDSLTESGKYSFDSVTDALEALSKYNSGMKKKGGYTLPGIASVQFNEPKRTTTIIWDDGSDATVVRCGEDETYQRYVGFCAAIVKKLFGTAGAKHMIDEKDVDLIKARRQKEAAERKAAKLAEEKAAHERNVAKRAKRYYDTDADLLRELIDMVNKLSKEPGNG